MEILVIVPTYNEADNLPQLHGSLKDLDLDLGLLVVDDNSPDGTGRLAADLAADDPRTWVLHREGKLGLGTAYVEGFNWAMANTQAPILVQMDADLSHDPAALPDLAAIARQGKVAVGSRYIPGGSTVNWGLGRRLLSRGGSLYARTILGLDLNDVTGGFKAWPREVLEDIDLDGVHSNGYSFQVEMNFRAHRRGFAIQETPISFQDRRVGHSKMSRQIMLEAVVMVWKLRARARKGLLGLIGTGTADLDALASLCDLSVLL